MRTPHPGGAAAFIYAAWGGESLYASDRERGLCTEFVDRPKGTRTSAERPSCRHTDMRFDAARRTIRPSHGNKPFGGRRMPASILRVATTIALTLILVACTRAHAPASPPTSPIGRGDTDRHVVSLGASGDPDGDARPAPPSATPVPERPASWTTTGDMLDEPRRPHCHVAARRQGSRHGRHHPHRCDEPRGGLRPGQRDLDRSRRDDGASLQPHGHAPGRRPGARRRRRRIGDCRDLRPEDRHLVGDRAHEVDPKPGDGNCPPRRQGPRGRREHQPQPRRRDRTLPSSTTR